MSEQHATWHQLATSRAMPDDIVGYTYRAANYCPDCIGHIMLPVTGGLTREEIAYQPAYNTETLLDVYARRTGINRTDERSYDSDNFPKVIFRDAADDYTFTHGERERCERCGTELG